jgi:hypothetical protein
MHSPIFLLASNNSDVIFVISCLVLPNMTISSAYANIDSLPTIFTFCLWVNSLMTFSKPILNSVGDKASLCRSPELNSNSDDSFPKNVTLHMVLAFQSFTISTYFFGIPKLIMAFHKSIIKLPIAVYYNHLIRIIKSDIIVHFNSCFLEKILIFRTFIRTYRHYYQIIDFKFLILKQKLV